MSIPDVEVNIYSEGTLEGEIGVADLGNGDFGVVGEGVAYGVQYSLCGIGKGTVKVEKYVLVHF